MTTEPGKYAHLRCGTYWNGHGCGLGPGHEGEWHICGPVTTWDGEEMCSHARKLPDGRVEVRSVEDDGPLAEPFYLPQERADRWPKC